MLIRVSKEELLGLLYEEIDAWGEVGGGANPLAFEFDPITIDTRELVERGYYENREAWIAGVRIAKLIAYIDEIEQQEM